LNLKTADEMNREILGVAMATNKRLEALTQREAEDAEDRGENQTLRTLRSPRLCVGKLVQENPKMFECRPKCWTTGLNPEPGE
jgi:hypothetical protein